MCRSKPELSCNQEIIALVYQIFDAKTEQYLKGILKLASHICKCEFGYISIMDLQGAFIQTRIGDSLYCLPLSDNFIGKINEPGKVYQFAKINAVDPMINEQTALGPIRWFSAGVALISPEGTWIGALWMTDINPRLLDEDQQHKLLRLASQIINHLETKKYTKALEDENNSVKK
jgi:hypothetical protein